jgi:hypothetical protein
MKAKLKFPKLIGDCVDRLYKLRALRLQISKQEAQVKAEETALKDHLLKQYGKQKLTGVRGRVAQLTIDKKTYPSVKDWGKCFPWVAKHKRWDLLRKQLNDAAWREMDDAGKTIPGVEAFTDVTFSVTKLGSKKK